MDKELERIKVIAFDADDTLWASEPLFKEAERIWAEALSQYGTPEELSAELFKVESANMEDLGYGAKAFGLSLVETAIKVSGGKVGADAISKTLGAVRNILHNPAHPLPGVERTLLSLRGSGKYNLVLLTKGDLLDQENKIRRSGLGKYFDGTLIVSNKDRGTYRGILTRSAIMPGELLMVGNSFRSDIIPVLEIGGWGAYVPFHVTWQHEVVEEFDHPRLLKLDSVEGLLPFLL